MNLDSNVTPDVFAELFGTTVDDLPEASIKHIQNSNWIHFFR